MSFATTWIKRLFLQRHRVNRTALSGRGRLTRRLLRVEPLEDRTCPSGPVILGSLSLGNQPLGEIAVNPSTDQVYVAGGFGSSPLLVVNALVPTNPLLVTSIGSSGSGVTVNPITDRFYSANIFGGQVVVYDGTNNSQLAAIGTGFLPGYLDIDPGKNFIYVGCQGGNLNDPVFVLNGATNTVVAGPLGSGYVMAQVHVNTATGNIYVNRNGVTRVFSPNYSFLTDLAGFGILAANPVTDLLYGSASSGLEVLDGTSHALLATIPGAGGTGSVAVNTNSNRIYVADTVNGLVKVIDGASNSVIESFSLGSNITPDEVAVDSAKNLLYVAGNSPSGSTLFVIRDGPNPLIVTTASDAVSHSGVSLRDAIATANTDAALSISDTITFDPSLNGATITLAQGQLELTAGAGSTTINGGGQINVSGNHASSVFLIDTGATDSLSGLTIEDGVGDTTPPGLIGPLGGGIANFGTLTVSDAIIAGNRAVGGGGILNNYGSLTVNNSTFTGNSAYGGSFGGLGGAIDLIYGTAVVSNTIFTGNSANGPGFGYGGAIANDFGSLIVTNSSFSANSSATGGAIGNNGLMTVSDSTFWNNSASSSGGGGGAIQDQTPATLFNVTLSGNSAPLGGAINAGGLLTVISSTISGNSAQLYGGGIFIPGNLVMQDTIVAGNSAGSGPDLFFNSGAVTANYTLIGNTANSGISGGTGNILNPSYVGLGPLGNNGGPTQTMALLPGSPAIDAGNNALAVDANGQPLPFDQRGPGFLRIVGKAVDMGAFEVQQIATTTAVTGSVNSSVFGQAVTLTAMIQPSTSGSGTPTGSVDFFDTTTNTDLGTVPLSGGSAALTTSTLAVGSHVIQVSYSGDSNFLPSTASLTQTVSPAPLTITANNLTIVYGGTLPALTASFSGFVNGDTSSSLTIQPNLSTTATTASHVGSYTITVAGAADPNYSITFVGGTLTITPAPLTISADNQTKVYGAPLPALTDTFAGLVNGDAAATFSVSPNVAPTLATTATASSDVIAGGYSITVSGAVDPDYAITFVNGTLTITPANQTILWSNPAAIIIGTPLSSTQLNATVSVVGPAPAGSLTYTPPTGTVLGPGSGQVLSVSAAGTQDYNAASATVTINVDYNFTGFLPPLSKNLAFALNRTIPIKFQLTDANGASIISLSAVSSLQIQALDANGNPVGSPFIPTAAGNTALRNDGSQYIFNWQTKGLAAGNYEILLTLADGTVKTKVIQLSANGGAHTQTASGSDGTGDSAGVSDTLLAGDLNVYINDPNGYFTPDELARIQDTINGLDPTLAPYGVTITVVSDSASANLVVDNGATSACGGAANGVLGCFNGPASEITILQGWNWYAGADSTLIGPGQYDFQTVVTHEFGHALGLGGDTDPTSPMYETLGTAQVRRVLTLQDLNLADAPAGPDPERAVPPPWATVYFLDIDHVGQHSNADSLTASQDWNPNPHAALTTVLADWSSTTDFAGQVARILDERPVKRPLHRVGLPANNDQEDFWSSISGTPTLDKIFGLTGDLWQH